MYCHRENRRPAGLLACTALAAVLATGFAASGQLALASASQFTSKQERKLDKAVDKAERHVERHPQDVSARVSLANSYLAAGRFEAAATTFEDAQHLGDETVRTALSLALAQAATGNNREAVEVLEQWRDAIPDSDLGLALALAGETSRGVAILSDALRDGEDTPKLRQNLAYAYALDGRWREARLLAAQDVPADKLDARISEWAVNGRPDDYRKRVANLLAVPVRSDAGQPTHLALVDRPSQAREAFALATPATDELPPVDSNDDFWIAEATRPEEPVAPVQPMVAEQQATTRFVERPVVQGIPGESSAPAVAVAEPAPVIAPVASDPVDAEVQASVAADFEMAFAPTGTTAAPVEVASVNPTVASVTFVSNPVVQAVPARSEPVAAQPARSSRKVSNSYGLVESRARGTVSRSANYTHLVQLGSFTSSAQADRAWNIYVSRNPELKEFDKKITKAVVRGKTYYRVAAAGFDKGNARRMCRFVKGRGGACIAYAQSNPLPGEVSGGIARASK